MIYLIFDPSTSLKRLVVKDDRRFSRDELKEITVKHLENIFVSFIFFSNCHL